MHSLTIHLLKPVVIHLSADLISTLTGLQMNNFPHVINRLMRLVLVNKQGEGVKGPRSERGKKESDRTLWF